MPASHQKRPARAHGPCWCEREWRTQMANRHEHMKAGRGGAWSNVLKYTGECRGQHDMGIWGCYGSRKRSRINCRAWSGSALVYKEVGLRGEMRVVQWI